MADLAAADADALLAGLAAVFAPSFPVAPPLAGRAAFAGLLAAVAWLDAALLAAVALLDAGLLGFPAVALLDAMVLLGFFFAALFAAALLDVAAVRPPDASAFAGGFFFAALLAAAGLPALPALAGAALLAAFAAGLVRFAGIAPFLGGSFLRAADEEEDA